MKLTIALVLPQFYGPTIKAHMVYGSKELPHISLLPVKFRFLTLIQACCLIKCILGTDCICIDNKYFYSNFRNMYKKRIK